jgi:hypothetical protein
MSDTGGRKRRPSGPAGQMRHRLRHRRIPRRASEPEPSSILPAPLRDAVRDAWTGVRVHLPLAPLWGAMMAASAWTALWLHGRSAMGQWSMILALFFAGGLLAFPVSVFLSRLLSSGRRAETRFAGTLLCLTLLTIGATAVLFALQYRLFYARWHAPFGTRIWLYQFTFTSAGALYQFIVMGVRLYLPVGVAALLAMSVWLVRADPVRR